MAAAFVANSEIVTSRTPLRPVRQNPSPSGPKLRQKMGQLVPQRAIDFVGAVFVQARIQRDEFVPKGCAPGASSEPRLPFHASEIGDSLGSGAA